MKSNVHKSHKKLWITMSIVAAVITLPVLTAAWYGFVPVVSSVFGSDKPRDLGVKYSQTDLAAYKQKAPIRLKDYANAPPDPKNTAEKAILANPKSTTNLVLTQEELTAAVNSTNLGWLPLKNMQVRLSDGIIEISGVILVNKLSEFKDHISGINNPDIDNAINWAQRLPNNPPFYAKGHADIKNNLLTFKLDKAEIGRFNIPLGSSGKFISQTTNTTIDSDTFVAKSATLTPGALVFSGTYPTSIYLEK